MKPITIDSNIPIPARTGRGRNPLYPFREMEVGESFFAAGKRTQIVLKCAHRHRPKLFSCRTVVENGVKGVRAWRVA